jgi:hypothetical protein
MYKKKETIFFTDRGKRGGRLSRGEATKGGGRGRRRRSYKDLIVPTPRSVVLSMILTTTMVVQAMQRGEVDMRPHQNQWFDVTRDVESPRDRREKEGAQGSFCSEIDNLDVSSLWRR